MIALLQEITRLAHVAVTRAQDRLFITGHRFAENTCDASNIGRFVTQMTSCNIWLTPLPTRIALPDDPAILTKEVHHGGEIEDELRHRARPLPGAGMQHLRCRFSLVEQLLHAQNFVCWL